MGCCGRQFSSDTSTRDLDSSKINEYNSKGKNKCIFNQCFSPAFLKIVHLSLVKSMHSYLKQYWKSYSWPLNFIWLFQLWWVDPMTSYTIGLLKQGIRSSCCRRRYIKFFLKKHVFLPIMNLRFRSWLPRFDGMCPMKSILCCLVIVILLWRGLNKERITINQSFLQAKDALYTSSHLLYKTRSLLAIQLKFAVFKPAICA